MSAIHLAKSAVSAFSREKPLSSITNWVDILTGPSYDDEAYDGYVQFVQFSCIDFTGEQDTRIGRFNQFTSSRVKALYI